MRIIDWSSDVCSSDLTIFYPSNVPNLINHNPLAAMAMATPIAHKGVIAGAKAVAFTVLDLLTTPQLISEAKAYFNNVQLKDQHYETLLSATEKPAKDRKNDG